MSQAIIQNNNQPDLHINRNRKFHTTFSQTSEVIQVVEFSIGYELFAVDLSYTREVINTPQVTPIPNSPPYITGMIDLRGIITTIIDIRSLMHITEDTRNNSKSRVIVLDQSVSRKRIGILVDDVSSVVTYNTELIDRKMGSSGESHREIQGIIRHPKNETEKLKKTNLVIWLDIKKLMDWIQDAL